jgi:hypothetical protein
MASRRSSLAPRTWSPPGAPPRRIARSPRRSRGRARPRRSAGRTCRRRMPRRSTSTRCSTPSRR